MSLQRQLFIVISILMVLLFSGIMSLTTYISREHLQQQLSSHATDAATSLSLILSEQAKSDDHAVMVSMIDAVFDRGYYQRIQLRDMNDKLIVDRQSEIVKNSQVPSWFIRLIRLDSPQAEALVMNGWQQVGKLTVKSHPGYAYQELWASLVAYASYLLMIALVMLVLGIVAIRRLLEPLRQLQRQARAIMAGHFPQQSRLPFTTELREVTQTMNHMTAKLKKVFEEQKQTATKLRQKVFIDPVSELYNQRHLKNHIQHYLTDSTVSVNGLYIHIELNGISTVNQQHGHSAGDSILKRFASMLKQQFKHYPARQTARLHGADFAIFILNVDVQELKEDLDDLAEHCAQMAQELSTQTAILTPHIAAVSVAQGTSYDAISATAAVALASARQLGPYNYQLTSTTDNPVLSETQWRTLIAEAIAEQRVTTNFEKFYSPDASQVKYQRVNFVITDADEQPYSSDVILPLAERYDVTHQLDKLIVEQVFSHLSSSPMPCVLPLATSTLTHPSFTTWFRAQLKKLGPKAGALTIEISELATSYSDDLKEFISELADYGVDLAIDHFGTDTHAFSYLNSLPVAYVKLDGRITRAIHQDEDNQFYAFALLSIAQSLDIPVLACKVSNKGEFSVLTEMGVDALEGSYMDQLAKH